MTAARALARLAGYAALWLLLIAACWALIVPAFLVGLIAGIVHEIRKHRSRRREAERLARLAAIRELTTATDDLTALAATLRTPEFDQAEIDRLRAIAAADAAEVTR